MPKNPFRQSPFLIAFAYILIACNPEKEPAALTINSQNESFNVNLVARGTQANSLNLVLSLNDSVTSTWKLYHPVYKLTKGDIDNDGNEDIVVGIIKPTRYDSVSRKRLFIYGVRRRSIIPLWLGSSLSQPLEDFAVHHNESGTFIRSIEHEQSGKYLVAEYEWSGFGLVFRKYVARESDLVQARTLLSR